MIELDVPRKERSMVLNSFFNPDSSFKVFLHEDVHILDYTSDPIAISGARIELFNNEDEFITELVHISGAEYNADFRPVRGEEYFINVEMEGFESISAVGNVPAELAEVQSVLVEQLDVFEYDFTLSLDDREGKDYYEIQAWEEGYYLENEDTVYISYPSYLMSSELYFDEYSSEGHSLYLDDVLFENQTIEITINTLWQLQGFCNENCIDFNVFVVVRRLSEEYFLYRESSELQDRLSDDPFAEPVNVFTNVNNGFGIFAGFNNNVIRIDVPENDFLVNLKDQ
ncbi:MAG: DUF4249 domain-containing protein [Balneolales bacterium]|nr:DUF4249 domain-containing protein [Balneolales bacterium]